LDLGADKMPMDLRRGDEPNPFLGWLAIRISLDLPDLFRTQLRAILRAGTSGNVRLMFPMISSVDELRAAKARLQACQDELKAEGIPFAAPVEVGIMIEVPGAAVIADLLAEEVDFFSLGTNDLTGYTLAVDRLNERVAGLFSPTHPAILRLIRHTVQAGQSQGRWVGVCGEMAGEPALVPLLVGLGVDELSVTPRTLPSIKFIIRRIKLSEAKKLAEQALTCRTGDEIQALSMKYAREVAPELFP
jgi:phosphotransferase system enzyme I (PtsI)